MAWKIKLKVNNREYITVYSYKGSERKSAIEDAIFTPPSIHEVH
jgi:hypothetical protein